MNALPSHDHKTTEALERALENHETVIWDFDGTIGRLGVDWIGLKRALAAVTLRETSRICEFTPLIPTFAQIIADFPRVRPFLEATILEFELRRGTFTPHHHVLETVKRWTGHRQFAILSSNMHATVDTTLRRHKIRDAFALIFGLDDVTEPKPNPEGAHTILSRLHGNARTVVMIGNDDVDRQTARAADIDILIINTAPELTS